MHPVAHTLVASAVVRLAKPAILRVARSDRECDARIDYRFAAFGAILPDLIDKPLAWVLFRGTFNDSHLFGHTLLFSVSLVGVGLALARKRDVRLLLVGIGALMHLPIDPVARNASTLLWPLLGTRFDYAKPIVPYSIIVDVALVLGLAVLARKSMWRERIRRFVTKGEFAGG